MTSEKDLQEALGKGEFTLEQAEAILERCLECGDALLATEVGRIVVLSVLNNWESAEERAKILNQYAVGGQMVYLAGRYLENCDPDHKPRIPGILSKINMERYHQAKQYIKEKINATREHRNQE